jgi:hypothetical protein
MFNSPPPPFRPVQWPWETSYDTIQFATTETKIKAKSQRTSSCAFKIRILVVPFRNMYALLEIPNAMPWKSLECEDGRRQQETPIFACQIPGIILVRYSITVYDKSMQKAEYSLSQESCSEVVQSRVDEIQSRPGSFPSNKDVTAGISCLVRKANGIRLIFQEKSTCASLVTICSCRGFLIRYELLVWNIKRF